MLEGLEGLVGKSLLRAAEGPDGEPWFSMLETIREYAGEQLAAAGETEEVRRRCAAYYLTLAEHANAALGGPDRARWLDRLMSEHDNLRQALGWCLSEPAVVAEGLRLAAALWLFWQLRGFLGEGGAWLERALAAPGPAPAAVRARALSYAGHAAWLQGDNARATILSEEGLALCPRTGQEQSEAAAYCRRNLVAAAVERGDYARAHDLAEESVAVARATGDRSTFAHALFERGRVAFFQGELAAARLAFAESLAAYRNLGDRPMVASGLGFLGRVATQQGEFALTRTYQEESLAIKRALGLRRHIAFSLTDLALAARLEGDFAQAQRLYAESLIIFRDTGDRNLLWALEGQAALLAAIEQDAPAARLLGAAAALRTTAGAPVPPVEQGHVAAAVAAVQGRLGRAGFAASWGAGSQLTLEQAVAAALAAGATPTAETAALAAPGPAGEVALPAAPGRPMLAAEQAMAEVAAYLDGVVALTSPPPKITGGEIAVQRGL